MKILFLGGTGVISNCVSRMAVARGFDLYLLNRGKRQGALPGAHCLVADAQKPEELRAALRGLRFDVVVDWIAYKPEHVERDLALFGGAVGHYIFISSASGLPKAAGALSDHRIHAPWPTPYWQYSRDKIACEERLLRALS
jgi:nucleoside-diphosphate-sugar epimerase